MDILAIAESQNGVVTDAQLRAAGLTRSRIRTRQKNGQLHWMHAGVYAVAPPSLLPLAAESAALLSFGARAVLGYRSAAALWSLTTRGEDAVDVLVVDAWPRRRGGVRIHRVMRLDPRDVTMKENLRLTAPARTVIDFATDAALSEIEYALSEGRALGRITEAKLDAALARAPANHPGAARVKALLRRQVGRVVTRSERERKLLELLAAAGLPAPRVNVALHGYRPDFYWPEQKLILEFDGYRTHGSRPRFESDRKRDQTFAAHGILTIRATWLQLEHEPVGLAVRTAQALASRTA